MTKLSMGSFSTGSKDKPGLLQFGNQLVNFARHMADFAISKSRLPGLDSNGSRTTSITLASSSIPAGTEVHGAAQPDRHGGHLRTDAG